MLYNSCISTVTWVHKLAHTEQGSLKGPHPSREDLGKGPGWAECQPGPSQSRLEERPERPRDLSGARDRMDRRDRLDRMTTEPFVVSEDVGDSHCFFPTCQVRVVRFYQSCSSLSPFFSSASFPSSSSSLSSSFSSTTFASTPMFTSALPTLRQALRQLPHAVGTAGPQLQGSERGHRWTSTWDLPSSVSTAGPQPGTLQAQWASLDLNGQIECQKICQIERQIECQKECQKIRYAR